MVENGRKWWKMGCRGYLVGNGFPRIIRHSPTTSHAIQSIKKSHSFIFPDTTMSKHQVFISNPGNGYYFEDSSCLILTIHLFRFNMNDNDYQLSCFESKTLIDFGTFHIIQFKPK